MSLAGPTVPLQTDNMIIVQDKTIKSLWMVHLPRPTFPTLTTTFKGIAGQGQAFHPTQGLEAICRVADGCTSLVPPLLFTPTLKLRQTEIAPEHKLSQCEWGEGLKDQSSLKNSQGLIRLLQLKLGGGIKLKERKRKWRVVTSVGSKVKTNTDESQNEKQSNICKERR